MPLYFLVFLFSQTFSAPAVKPQDWEIDSLPGKEMPDAIFLKDEISIEKEKISHHVKVRVLTEEGKDVIKSFAFSGDILSLQGRVTTRSGDVYDLSRDEHLIEKDTYQSEEERVKRRILLPPGLTSDCIIEVQWSEKAEDGLPVEHRSKKYAIPRTYPIVKKKIIINETLKDLSNIEFGNGIFPLLTRFFWTKVPPPAKFNRYFLDGKIILEIDNIPAIERAPYGSILQDEALSFLYFYKTLPFDHHQAQVFWQQFSRDFIRYIYEIDYLEPQAYREFLSDLKKHLPKRDDDAFFFVMNQLKARIQYHDFLKPETKSAIPPDIKENSQSRSFLKEVFERGYTSSRNMGYIYYFTLKKLGFKPQIVFSSSLRDSAFDPKVMNPFALHLSTPLFLLDSKDGGLVFVCPGFADYPTGAIPPYRRGGAAIIMNPWDNWSYKFVKLTPADPYDNRVIYQYQINLQESGSTDLTMKIKGYGSRDAEFRRRYYPLPLEEQREVLANAWRIRLGEWHIQSARIDNVHNLEKNIEMYLGAQKDIQKTSKRAMSLHIFPGDLSEMSIPRDWPSPRSQPIMLTRRLNRTDISMIHLPPEWDLDGWPAFSRENKVGLVRLKAENKGGKWTFKREIKLKNSYFSPAKEADFKAFLSWVELLTDPSVFIKKPGLPE